MIWLVFYAACSLAVLIFEIRLAVSLPSVSIRGWFFPSFYHWHIIGLLCCIRCMSDGTYSLQVTVCEKIIFHKLYTSVPFSLRQNMVVLYCLFANIHMNYKEFWVTYVHNYKQITLLSISYARAHISLITLYSILINYYSYMYIPW